MLEAATGAFLGPLATRLATGKWLAGGGERLQAPPKGSQATLVINEHFDTDERGSRSEEDDRPMKPIQGC